MLPPHEIKQKKFPFALRGYAQSEVDEYIAFLTERYSEVYLKNDELERKLRQARSRIEELERKEDAINRALVRAQKLEEKIIKDAEDRANAMISSAKRTTGSIISDFDKELFDRKARLHALMQSSEEFRNTLVSAYEAQLAAVKDISPQNADPEWDRSDEEYVNYILDEVRGAVESANPPPDDDEQEIFSKGEGEFKTLEDFDREMSEKENAVPEDKAPETPAEDPHDRVIIETLQKKVIKRRTTGAKRTPGEIGRKEKTSEDTEPDEDLKKLFGNNG